MSYVDLMSNERWSEHDHVRRTEALVREHWTAEDEAILNRKFVGALAGQNALTAQDQADISDFKAVTVAAQEAGAAGRVDSARLDAALDFERARDDLVALPPVPTEGEDPDADKRAQLQAAVDGASQDTLDLVAQRDALRALLNPPQDPLPQDPSPQDPPPEVQS